MDEIRFSAESIRRKPTADLGGGTSFVLCDVVALRAKTVFSRLCGVRATPMTAFFELFWGACALGFGRRAIERDK